MSAPINNKTIYKICGLAEWREAKAAGVYQGAPVDQQDGYIHFSASDQVLETANMHFAGRNDLLLLAVDAPMLGNDLKWEVSRGGARFPHLYAPLDLDAVKWETALPLGSNGTFAFPELEG